MVVIGDWGYMLFLAAADRELPCSLGRPPSVDMHRSSDDSACLCNVESIQDDPQCPVIHLCAADCRHYFLGSCLCQPL